MLLVHAIGSVSQLLYIEGAFSHTRLITGRQLLQGGGRPSFRRLALQRHACACVRAVSLLVCCISARTEQG